MDHYLRKGELVSNEVASVRRDQNAATQYFPRKGRETKQHNPLALIHFL